MPRPCLSGQHEFRFAYKSGDMRVFRCHICGTTDERKW